MKMSLAVDKHDRLNFFRLYDGCLMDVAVISWCKFFGSSKENLFWLRLFPEVAPGHTELRGRLLEAAQGDLKALSETTRNYRDTYVAHHDLNETKRAKDHPSLHPLQATGQVLYKEVYSTLDSHGYAGGLPHPDRIMGTGLREIEAQWKRIVEAVRTATQGFREP